MEVNKRKLLCSLNVFVDLRGAEKCHESTSILSLILYVSNLFISLFLINVHGVTNEEIIKLY